MKTGLNIGCGGNYMPRTLDMRWINIDADPQVTADRYMDVEQVTQYVFPEVDEIVAIDILEHVPYRENDKERWMDVLQGWVNCLKPGGVITIQVPSVGHIWQAFNDGKIDESTMLRVIYGERTTPWDRHYQLFTYERLEQALKSVGLETISMMHAHVNILVHARKP